MRLSLVMMSQPLPGGLRNPDAILGRRVLDGAGRPLPPVHDAARVAWVGDIGPEANKDLGEAKHVRVAVEADIRRLRRPGHAARTEFSYASAQRTSVIDR